MFSSIHIKETILNCILYVLQNVTIYEFTKVWIGNSTSTVIRWKFAIELAMIFQIICYFLFFSIFTAVIGSFLFLGYLYYIDYNRFDIDLDKHLHDVDIFTKYSKFYIVGTAASGKSMLTEKLMEKYSHLKIQSIHLDELWFAKGKKPWAHVPMTKFRRLILEKINEITQPKSQDDANLPTTKTQKDRNIMKKSIKHIDYNKNINGNNNTKKKKTTCGTGAKCRVRKDGQFSQLQGSKKENMNKDKSPAIYIVDGNYVDLNSNVLFKDNNIECVIFLDYGFWLIFCRLLKREFLRWWYQIAVCNGNIVTWEKLIKNDLIKAVWKKRASYLKRISKLKTRYPEVHWISIPSQRHCDYWFDNLK